MSRRNKIVKEPLYVNCIPPSCPNACCGPINNYSQCRLAKKVKNGEYKMISWIPEEFAVKGKVLKLFDGENWDNGWEVISAGKSKPGRDYQDHVICECGHFGYFG